MNPNSTAQGAVRARMSANAAAWRTITDAQRAGWSDLGASMVRNDALGQSYTLTGFMAYCSVNNNLETAGSAPLDDAPALTTPSALLTATLDLADDTFDIAFTDTPLPADAKLLVFASPQRSAGRGFEGDFRLIMTSAAAAASPVDALAAYTAKFGVPVPGNRIFVNLQVALGGFVSGPLITSDVVA